MRLVFAEFDDGVQTYLLMVGLDFDLDAWARERVNAFRLLGISKISCRDIPIPVAGRPSRGGV